MTLNEITVLIASHFDRQLDEPFKLMLAERVHYWRARLIKNSVDKNPAERRFFKQVIYVKFEEADDIPCGVPFEPCKIAISTTKIPRPMRANGILFDYVGSIDGMTPFAEGAAGTMSYLKAGRYSKLQLRYTYENERIKVYGNSKLPYGRLDGVFDNPEEADRLNCQNQDKPCDFRNQQYPVTGDILQSIVQSILQIDFNRPAEDEQVEIKATDIQ